MNIAQPPIDNERTVPPWVKSGAVAIVVLSWLATTVVFWVGYAGSDDLFYSRYAFLLHRPPMNWWEFRMPAVLAIRAAFLALGPTEFAATLPTLLSTAGIMAAVAWFIQWPSKLNWQTQCSMLLAATLPLDVIFRTIPGAAFFAGGFLALGTVCLLKGGGRVQLLGSALLALGFSVHELFVYYVGIICLVAFAMNRKRFLRPMVACIGIASCFIAIEAVSYYFLLGHPLARFQVAAATTVGLPIGYDPDTGLQGIRFFTWPLESLVYCKNFGFDLGLLFLTGAIAWKQLSENQRILLVATFGIWLWLGFGSQVPWAYKPFYRQMHYYSPLTLGVAALIPVTVGITFAGRQWMGKALITLALAVHVLSLGAGGRWGQDVDVSRELLHYAKAHPKLVFLTDIGTMNQMYALGGFQLPSNVISLNGPALKHLLVNKEPAGTPPFQFPNHAVDGVLINTQFMDQKEVETDFLEYMKDKRGAREVVAPVVYKPLFYPFIRFKAWPIMIKSLGGEVMMLSR